MKKGKEKQSIDEIELKIEENQNAIRSCLKREADRKTVRIKNFDSDLKREEAVIVKNTDFIKKLEEKLEKYGLYLKNTRNFKKDSIKTDSVNEKIDDDITLLECEINKLHEEVSENAKIIENARNNIRDILISKHRFEWKGYPFITISDLKILDFDLRRNYVIDNIDSRIAYWRAIPASGKPYGYVNSDLMGYGVVSSRDINTNYECCLVDHTVYGELIAIWNNCAQILDLFTGKIYEVHSFLPDCTSHPFNQKENALAAMYEQRKDEKAESHARLLQVKRDTQDWIDYINILTARGELRVKGSDFPMGE
jgi:hypothetical protein